MQRFLINWHLKKWVRYGIIINAPTISRRGEMVHAVDSKSTGGNTLGVRVPPPAPKCVDERCNAENAARKCGVFAYNALLLEQKGCKNSIFQNFSFAPARGDIFNALPDLWSGVVRTPRLKNKENQQPLYPLPLFWRVRQRLFLSDGSRTHNLKWEP